MTGSLGAGRLTVALLCVVGSTAAVALGVTVSAWFLVALPFLAAAGYAAVLGMSTGRFVDALDDGTSGRTFPF